MNRWGRNSQLDILLGGKWAISTRGALIMLPFVVLAAPYGNAPVKISRATRIARLSESLASETRTFFVEVLPSARVTF